MINRLVRSLTAIILFSLELQYGSALADSAYGLSAPLQPSISFQASESDVAYDVCQSTWDGHGLAEKTKSVAVAAGINLSAGKSSCFFSWARTDKQAAINSVMNNCRADGWPKCFLFATDDGLTEWVAAEQNRIMIGERQKTVDAVLNSRGIRRKILEPPNDNMYSKNAPLRARLYSACSIWFNMNLSQMNFRALVGDGNASCHDGGYNRRTQQEAVNIAMQNCRTESSSNDCFLFSKGDQPEPWALEEEAIVASGTFSSQESNSTSGASIADTLLNVGAAAIQGYAGARAGNLGPVGGMRESDVTTCPAGYYRGSRGYGNAFTCMPYGQGPSGNQQYRPSGISGTN